MIERASSADLFNSFLNDPYVRPDVATDELGTLDISTVMADPRNVVLQGEHGGFVFVQIVPGVYEVHTVTLKSGRGQWAVDVAHAASRYLFTQTDAFEITTRIPRKHLGARTLALNAGMMLDFSVPDGCRWRGIAQPIDIYSFRIQDWIKDADDCVDTGRWFHGRLLEEARRIGVTDNPHPNDDVHNRYVGACMEMAFAGQVIKAVNFYNRWALCARHPAIQLLALDPPTIKMDIGILRIVGNDIEVSQCQ
jgi:hypothetical protein